MAVATRLQRLARRRVVRLVSRALHPDGPAVLWDPELAPRVRRLAAEGVHSLTFTENPSALGYPSFHDASWDPLWASLCDEQFVLSIHLGSSGQLAITAPDAPVDVMITLQPMNICSAASDLLWSRVIKTFPEIRIALSEGGTGWIPYFLDRVDRTYEMHHKWTGQDFGGKLPSEVFREHFLTCFISDPVGVQLRHQIGIDNIAWECDYPHSDSSWPHAPEEVALWRPPYRTMNWRRSPGRMPAAGTPSIRWRTGHGSAARCGRCGLKRSDTTCPSAPTTTAASSEPGRVSTSQRSRPRPPPRGSPAVPPVAGRARAARWHSPAPGG